MTAEEVMKIRKAPTDHESDITINWDEMSQCIDEALEKQIAKKVIKYKSCPEDIVLCPVCGSTFVSRNGFLMRYCSNCGQRLEKNNEEM